MDRRIARQGSIGALVLVLAGCASAPDNAAALVRREEALQRQALMDKEPPVDGRGVYLARIREMQREGRYFASLAHADAFVQQHGAAPDVDLLRAHALRETGHEGDSDAIYRRLLGGEFGAQAAQGMGLLAGRRGDYGAAAEALRQALRRDPTNPLIASDLGYALMRQGRVAEARLPIAQAAELGPDQPRIIGNLALWLRVSGDVAGSDAVMERAQLGETARAAIRRMAEDMTRGSAMATPVSPPAVRDRREAPAAPVSAPAVGDAPPAVPAQASARPAVVRVASPSEGGQAALALGAEPMAGERPAGPMASLLERFGVGVP